VRTSTSRGRSQADKPLQASDVDRFNKVVGQMASLRDEFAVLSKTKPDNALNEFKLGFVDEKLDEANHILSGDDKPFASFEQFDTEKLPSNSDVLVTLSQYLACLERWRSAHVWYSQVRFKYLWSVENAEIEADGPTRPRA